MLSKIFRILNELKDRFLDRIFLPIDKTKIRRTKNLRLIPNLRNRRGGKVAYVEWGHVIGIFQTLIGETINQKNGVQILDVGCGTGLLGIAAENYVSNGGKYTGIDVIEENIKICEKIYKMDNYEFIYFKGHNQMYTTNDFQKQKRWSFDSSSFDLITALSVWTHFGSKDAIFYMHEIDRVLKENGKAIVTFFYLDVNYFNTLSTRENKIGQYNQTLQSLWIFDQKFEDSDHWLTTSWTNVPEEAVGVTKNGLDSILENTSLKIEKIYSGSWKEKPGVYFQDVLVLSKNQ